MASNTTFNPPNENDFDKTKMQKDAKGLRAVISASGSTNIDLDITDDVLLVGGFLIVTPAFDGDTVDFQVVHPIAGVIAQFISGWQLDPSTAKQDTPTSKFPAKIPAGLKLRVVYHATGPDLLGLLNTQIVVKINFDMHKVLI